MNTTETIPRFTGYAGGKRFVVHHPDHEDFYCYAPTPVAAIITAAGHWGEQWNEERFYDQCRPERVCA